MNQPETTAKEEMVSIIAKQPDDSTYDELLRELTCSRLIQRGLADADGRQTPANAEMRDRINSWQQ